MRALCRPRFSIGFDRRTFLHSQHEKSVARRFSAVASMVLLGGLAIPSDAQLEQMSSPIKSDEEVLFFPTAARLSEDRRSWIVPVHGWIFEPEEGRSLRGRLARELLQAMGLKSDQAANTVFDQRIRWFLADNERGKRLAVRIREHSFTLAASSPGGHFTGTIELPIDPSEESRANRQLHFACVTHPTDPREFRGYSFCLPPEGLSVISDIDDTIKITEVLDRKKLLENTFLREFRAVDGMAVSYQKWAKAGAQFHYVSSSPWQLYPPLSKFLKEAEFPNGTFHLRYFRLKDSSFLQLLENPIPYKLKIIETLVRDYPNRKFILVGDSGEKDPEVYGIVARRFPSQIIRIYIRNVTGGAANQPRFEKAFQEVPTDRWSLFQDASQLTQARYDE